MMTNNDSTRSDFSDPPITAGRMERAKFAYTTRHVQRCITSALEFGTSVGLDAAPTVVPTAGDVVLARVLEIGHHRKLELPTSRRSGLFVGDEIVVAYGNRYAADQFHAVVPSDLLPCDLVAAGGVAGQVVEMHAAVRPPTRILPLGLITLGGRRLRLDHCAPHMCASTVTARFDAPRPKVVAVLGTSMNSGKTTAAAHLIRGLTDCGMRVGAGKVTGTGAGNDANYYRDAGAAEVLDFTDFGYVTTFGVSHTDIAALLGANVQVFADRGCDVVVIEIADGLLQGETRDLLGSTTFGSMVDHVVFAAGDALGACAGVDFLTSLDVAVSAVSGLLTASPLQSAEARRALSVPVIDTSDLASARVAGGLIGLETSVAALA